VSFQRLQDSRALSFKAKHLQLTISDGVVHDELCNLSTSGDFASNAQEVLGQAQLSFQQFQDLVDSMGQLLQRISTVTSLVDQMAEVGHSWERHVDSKMFIAPSVCKHGLDDAVRRL
jgi:enamine deaminase RidA (YjgF/YER057c/UK114 family)